MSAQVHHEAPSPTQAIGAMLDDLSGVAAVLAAGARARSVADVCEAHGLAAVLLDGSGRVLHVGPLAAALLGRELRIEADHVLGDDAFTNEAVESVLNPILGEGAPGAQATGMTIAPVSRAGHLVIGALAYADGLPGQLLKAILLIGTRAEDLRERAFDLGSL